MFKKGNYSVTETGRTAGKGTGKFRAVLLRPLQLAVPGRRPPPVQYLWKVGMQQLLDEGLLSVQFMQRDSKTHWSKVLTLWISFFISFLLIPDYILLIVPGFFQGFGRTRRSLESRVRMRSVSLETGFPGRRNFPVIPSQYA